MEKLSKKRRQRGLSLVEAVITVALIGFIVLGVVPLFHRAVMNNIYGGDASQMTAFSRSGLETLVQRTANSDSFFDDATGAGDEDVGDLFRSEPTVIRYMPSYWDTGAFQTVASKEIGLDAVIGDERWRNDPDDVVGVKLWRAAVEKREYGYSDVNFGTIDPTSGTSLVQEGHPKLFDTPLPIFESGTNTVDGFSGGDISELRLVVESGRAREDLGTFVSQGDPSPENTNKVAMSASGLQQKVVVSLFRVF